MNRELEQFLLQSLRDPEPCDSWNEFRKLRPAVNDLSSINLDKYRLAQADFRKMNFCGSKARNAHFEHCDFSGSDMFDVEMQYVHFENCTFIDCDFSNSYLQYCHFNGCNFRDAKFVNARLDWPVFKNTNLAGCDFLTATMIKADLREIHLIETAVNVQKLEDSYLSRLYSAKFSEITIHAAQPNYINKQFVDKSLREICMDLSMDQGINLVASGHADRECGLITTRILGLTIEKYLEMLCAVHSLELEQIGDSSAPDTYQLKRKMIQRASGEFRNAPLAMVGQFITVNFGCSVKFDTDKLAQSRITLSLHQKSLREVCIEVCKVGRCRVATHIKKQGSKLEVTEDREVDFNLVKHLHFYQV